MSKGPIRWRGSSESVESLVCVSVYTHLLLLPVLLLLLPLLPIITIPVLAPVLPVDGGWVSARVID